MEATHYVEFSESPPYPQEKQNFGHSIKIDTIGSFFFFNDCLIPPSTYQFRVVQDGFGLIFSIDLKIPVHTRSFEIVPESCHLLIGLSLHKYLSMLLIIAGKIDVPSNLIVDYT